MRVAVENNDYDMVHKYKCNKSTPRALERSGGGAQDILRYSRMAAHALRSVQKYMKVCAMLPSPTQSHTDPSGSAVLRWHGDRLGS